MSLLSWILGQCSPERRPRKCHDGAEVQAVLQGELHRYVLGHWPGIIHFTVSLLVPIFACTICKELSPGFLPLCTGAWAPNRHFLDITFRETARPLGESSLLHERNSSYCYFKKACKSFWHWYRKMVNCKLLRRREKNWILPFEGRAAAGKPCISCGSFALYKEIAVKEDPGAWFVPNKTEDIVPLICIIFLFLDILSQTIKPYNVSFFSSSMWKINKH